MKKNVLIYIFIAFLAASGILMLKPQSVIGSRNAKVPPAGTEIPDSVMKIFRRACMDCHSDDGTSMARGKVNFDKWSAYDAEKQVKKAGQICKQVTKGSMPPKGWRKNNPNDIPTQSEIDLICKWSQNNQK